MNMIRDGTALKGVTMAQEQVPKQKILPLCLYLIEKDFHFTGDGIWVDTSSTAPTEAATGQ